MQILKDYGNILFLYSDQQMTVSMCLYIHSFLYKTNLRVTP